MNPPHYKQNQKGLLICATRSGGTMLSHLLDSHPNVFCTRGEVIHSKNAIRKLAGANPIDGIEAMLNLPGYWVNIVKLTYPQFHAVLYNNPYRINIDFAIHLVRRNILRRFVSDEIRKLDKRQYTHTYRSHDQQQIAPDPEWLYTSVSRSANANQQILSHLVDFPRVFTVYYEDIVHDLVDGYWLKSRKIEDFLGIKPFPMQTSTKRVNSANLAQILSNYGAIETRFANTGYEWMLYE